MKSSFTALLWGLLCFLLLVSSAAAQDEISDLLGRINNLRANKGLPAYTLNGALSSAAQSQSQWLIDNDCAIAHTHPDGSSPRSRAQAAGYASTDVSENIYCGGLATVDDAWIFWINSPIHYAGLTNTRYKEIGIGVAHGSNGSGFTLVFGNPGGPAYVPPPASSGGGNNGNASSAPLQPPSYVVGVDEHGNIKHEIQPGDTIGDILLIYGYTWADIPTLLALNNMTQEDFRSLKVGEILLIPPQAGTYTPTPGDAPTATPEAPTSELPTATAPAVAIVLTDTPPAFEPTASPTANSAEMTVMAVLTDAAQVTPSPTAASAAVAFVPTSTVIASPTAPDVALNAAPQPASVTKSSGTVTTHSGPSTALIIALVVQVAVLVGAGFEFIRRMRRRKS